MAGVTNKESSELSAAIDRLMDHLSSKGQQQAQKGQALPEVLSSVTSTEQPPLQKTAEKSGDGESSTSVVSFEEIAVQDLMERRPDLTEQRVRAIVAESI